jgi:hypothetical protein
MMQALGYSDLRASGGITSILGQIAARQNLNMSAGGDMVFVGGAISAGGNARLSAGGNLSLIAYDTGKQIRAHSPRDEEGNPIGKGPVWSMENSTYNQTGVSIDVGGSLSASAGGNLVAQGVNANVGGSTSLSAGGDMQLTTALNGHVNTFNFFNRYKNSGGLVKVEHSINRSDTHLTNSGNTWSSGGAVNLSSGGDMSLVGAQINGQGFTPRAGGDYEERAAYDIKEKVNVESVKNSGVGVYIADFINTTSALATGGAVGGKSETARTETHIDSTRTAVLTRIDAGSGTVTRSAGGDAYIEVSVVRGAVVNPLTAGGVVTEVAAVDTRHVEDSVFTSTIRWQSTKSTGSIEQTLHLPQIHGTIPAGLSAYQGAGGVSVQLPAGADVRTAIETLSKEPGKEYLKELGNRSDVDWQRVEALNKSLDFSKSGLTPEATIVVVVVVSILTYGTASGWGAAAANYTGSAAVGAAVTAGTTSLASTAAVSLINNKGDIGAVLKELGSQENLQGLALTMATAGLTQGLLDAIPADTSTGFLNGVDASSSFGQLMARNTVQGISSAVLESAVLGTDLEDALKNNLQGALINTGAALGANAIGNAAQGANGIDATSKAIAHALLGCAIGSANAGNISGCAPGAAGAVIGELVAGWYGDSQNLGDLEDQLKDDPTNATLRQQIGQIRNTVTELSKLSGAGSALLIGGDAADMQIAMTTGSNAAVNNFLNHAESSERKQLKEALLTCEGDACAPIAARFNELNTLDKWRDAQLSQACLTPSSADCQGWNAALQIAAQSYEGQPTGSYESSELSRIKEDVLKYGQEINNPTAYGIGKGLFKLLPPVLGVTAAAGTVATVGNILEQGVEKTVVDAANGIASLPEAFKTRLNSTDPSVRAEAMVDLLALGTGAAAVTVGGVKATLSAVEKAKVNAAMAQAEVDAVAKAKIENSARRDDAQQYVNTNAPVQVPETVTRNDNDFSSTINHRGNPKAHIDESGNLVSANPNGTGSPTAHVSGSNPGNTPYISATDAASVDPTLGGPKTYGSQQTTVNARDLQRDINSGAVSQNIQIINNQQLAKQLQDKVDAAQRRFDANPSPANVRVLRDARRDLNAAKRDGEVLITPYVSPAYYSKPTGPVTPIVPVLKVPSTPTMPSQSIK